MSKYSSDHPGPFTLSNGISIEFDEFPQNKFSFLHLKLTERMCGEHPYGELQLKSIEEPAMDEKFKKVNFFKINLKEKDPYDEYELTCFVVHHDWSPEVGIFTLNFMCVPFNDEGKNGKYFSKTKVATYKQKKIKDLIKEIWNDDGQGPRYPRFRWKTKADPPPEDWWQDRWCTEDFLNRLCLSIQKNTLFCYDFDGLMIKDITGWKAREEEKPEPYRIISGYASMQPISDHIENTYSYRLYRPIENSDTEGDYKWKKAVSKRFQPEIHEDIYRVYHKDIDSRQKIYKHNLRLVEDGFYNTIFLRYKDHLPPVRLGETVYYAKATDLVDPEEKTFIVYSIDLFLSGNMSHHDEEGEMYHCKIELRGIIDRLGQELPNTEGQDPAWK